MSSQQETVSRTVIVAAVLCLVCSVIVSGAAVLLKPTQVANQVLDKKRNILVAAGLFEEGKDVETLFKKVETKVVDVRSGEYVTDVDPAAFDQRKMSKDPKNNITLTGDQDIASIKRQAKYASVYLVRDDSGNIKTAVLPVHGYGLWSTMYGFIALESDFSTVSGITFYEQGETAGLGGEIVNPAWQALWKGKKLLDKEGNPVISLVKGGVSATSPTKQHEVDALSGATLTTRGVENLMRFWLGENGFGPYIAKQLGHGG